MGASRGEGQDDERSQPDAAGKEPQRYVMDYGGGYTMVFGGKEDFEAPADPHGPYPLAEDGTQSAAATYDRDALPELACEFCGMVHENFTACPSADADHDAMVLPRTWK